jgi:hypothetical protein
MRYIDKYGVEYSYDGKTLECCPDDFEGEYVVPEGVVKIGSNAFQGCIGLTSIVVPCSVHEIQSEAFSGCTSLKSIEIPNGVIDHQAFMNCTGLVYVKLDAGVRSIGWSAFENCTNLESIQIGSGVSEICHRAFYNCCCLKEIVIPRRVSTIMSSTFAKCSNIESVEIRGNLTTIEDRAFYFCGNLVSIDLPDSIIEIGESAFGYCKSLVSVHIPYSLKQIKRWTFNNCESLSSVMIPDNVETIENGAFSICNGMTSIFIGKGVSKIGDSALQYCSKLSKIQVSEENIVYSSLDGVLFDKERTILLMYPENMIGIYVIPYGVRHIDAGAFYHSKITNITIPHTVESIGRMAFSRCLDLTTINIPRSVTEIGEMAFHKCENLKSIVVDEDNPNFCSIENVLFDKEQTTLIKCPNIIEGSYRIPGTVKKISKAAFEGCNKITSIKISGALSIIEEMAFSECSSINAFYVDEENLSFSSKEGVLYNKDKTELVLFPNTYEGDYSIPDGVTTIKTCAFDSCKALTSLTIPNTVKKVEGGCLLGCVGLDTIKIPEGKSLRFEVSDGRIINSGFINVCNVDNHISSPKKKEELNVEALREIFDANNVEADKKLRKAIGGLDDEQLKILGEIFGSK